MNPTNLDNEISNSTLLDDELQALSAIFGDEWTIEDDNMYSIRIRNSSANEVYFQITIPKGYPLYSPPNYQISAPWMSRTAKDKLYFEIENVYSLNIGESIIYLWIDTIRNFIQQESCNHSELGEAEADGHEYNIQDLHLQHESTIVKKGADIEVPQIEHGEPIIDRKSVFQAHLAKVIHVDQVRQVLEKLKENRKIAMATHNIYAYRIVGLNKNSFIQDCEDDGETKAGSGLLHLLQVLDVSDVLIIVSRWYGGIHLGSDRFKHINNAARTLLNQLGYIKNEKSKPPAKDNKKLHLL